MVWVESVIPVFPWLDKGPLNGENSPISPNLFVDGPLGTTEDWMEMGELMMELVSMGARPPRLEGRGPPPDISITCEAGSDA